MNNKKFDHIIKEKMDHLITESNIDGWSKFESKWNELNINNTGEDLKFDTLIKKKVYHQKQTYNAEHWLKMKEELRIIDERRNTVFISKVLEFAAIFLFVFTFSHLSGLMYFDNGVKNESNVFASASSTEALKNSEYNKPSVTTLKFTPETKNNTIIPIQKPIIATDTDATIGKPDFSENIVSGVSNHGSVITQSDDILLPSDTDSGSKTENIKIENYLSEETDLKENITDNDLTLALLPTSDIKYPESEIAMIFPMKLKTPPHVSKIALSAYVSGDINLINTPFDKLYSLASYNKEALNNSYGINISKQKNNFEAETGLGYALREYQPKLVTEAYGQNPDFYFEKSLKKISFDLVNIPINLKYHFVTTHNFSIYVMAGAAINLVMNAEYDIFESLRQGRPPVGRYTPEQARLDEKPFIRGILNGDNIKDNYFGTIGFGFGVEKKLFSNTSIYIQPSYQRQFISADIGIGPNKDKIHTSSLQFGIKTIIN